MNSLTDIRKLSLDEILLLIKQAEHFKADANPFAIYNDLKGIAICLAFFENSTRTKLSFDLAAKRLNALVLNFETGTSSLAKGESVLETVRTLEAMNIRLFVVRHTENDIAQYLTDNSNSVFINGGDGTNSHPSQALLDTVTLREQFGESLNGLRICIVGDIKHSRVARSNFELLTKLGVNLSFSAPKELHSDYISESTKLYESIDDAVKDNDVIMCLRVQKERMQNLNLDYDHFISKYALKEKHIIENKELHFMHPGPINYGVEIESSLINHNRSLINKQVANGVFTRMAILSHYAKQLK